MSSEKRWRCGEFSSHLAAESRSSLAFEILVANDGNDEGKEYDRADDDAADQRCQHRPTEVRRGNAAQNRPAACRIDDGAVVAVEETVNQCGSGDHSEHVRQNDWHQPILAETSDENRVCLQKAKKASDDGDDAEEVFLCH